MGLIEDLRKPVKPTNPVSPKPVSPTDATDEQQRKLRQRMRLYPALSHSKKLNGRTQNSKKAAAA